jgi:methionine-rich copper-binding protein CopC
MYKDLLKTKNARVIFWIVVIIAIALFFWLTAPKSASKTRSLATAGATSGPATNANAKSAVDANSGTNMIVTRPQTGAAWKRPAPKPVGFTEKKTPHFVSANISNNETLSLLPPVLTLNFNADVLKTQESFVSVKKDDIDSVTTNPSYIDGETMSVKLNDTAADGDYYVYYVACFADTGCSDGRFGYHLKLP